MKYRHKLIWKLEQLDIRELLGHEPHNLLDARFFLQEFQVQRSNKANIVLSFNADHSASSNLAYDGVGMSRNVERL
ncbi:hypothetical protein PsorP6_011612 [Peronosclerospora sorghi]|uniref:Uncharacterized protein n=1 Tax=Peronosclerospora sorghi TaxID=230839 RepID=A0ACC0WK46_9STRA|nr:hypothetical protein PsorP6_011612 [Peronosclerospora sorghi]